MEAWPPEIEDALRNGLDEGKSPGLGFGMGLAEMDLSLGMFFKIFFIFVTSTF